jgi:hypothetical protein
MAAANFYGSYTMQGLIDEFIFEDGGFQIRRL